VDNQIFRLALSQSELQGHLLYSIAVRS